MRLVVDDDAEFANWLKTLARAHTVLLASGSYRTADLVLDLRDEINDAANIKDVPYA